MTTPADPHRETYERIKEVRAQAIHHARLAQQFAKERRELDAGP